DFSNYAEELKGIIVEVGGYPFTTIPHLNPAVNRKNKLTNDEYYVGESRRLIATKYARDITMWQEYRAIWDA
ncbi:MAG: hypothetical protein QQN63_12880, partial [Nitrosopumilus sp.]